MDNKTGVMYSEIPVNSDLGKDTWNEMFKAGVFAPVRVIPTIATNPEGEDMFILAFGFGDTPQNITGYKTVAITIEGMEKIAPDIVQQIIDYRAGKAH